MWVQIAKTYCMPRLTGKAQPFDQNQCSFPSIAQCWAEFLPIMLVTKGHFMDDLISAIREAMEQAAILGLCRDGQLEIGAEEARKVSPELDDAELLRLVADLHDKS